MDFIVFLSQQWLLVAILAVLVSGLIFVEGKRGGDALGVHELTRLVNQGNSIIVDVRDASDFKTGHIVDAINIPYQKILDRSEELEKYKDKTIVLVDKMGQHSGASGKQLKEKGFNVSRLRGGMSEWTAQSLPVVKT